MQRPEDVRSLMRFYGASDAEGERLAALLDTPPARRTNLYRRDSLQATALGESESREVIAARRAAVE
jgi:hypothetical protein